MALRRRRESWQDTMTGADRTVSNDTDQQYERKPPKEWKHNKTHSNVTMKPEGRYADSRVFEYCLLFNLHQLVH